MKLVGHFYLKLPLNIQCMIFDEYEFDNRQMKNIESIYSINKKKSKQNPSLEPYNKQSYQKSLHSRNKSRTENSPTAYRSLSKEQIKSTIKNIVQGTQQTQQQPHNKMSKLSNIREQQQKKSKKSNKNKLQISIPNIRTSLTPKSFKGNYYEAVKNDRQVHSTKAADHHQLFTNSGRYDLKQLFENTHKQPLGRDSLKPPNNSVRKMQPRQHGHSRVEEKKLEDATIKFNREDDFDVKKVLTSEQYEKFGQRFPEKFKRIGLLGRGGFSVVWLGMHRGSKRKVAIKQILTKNPHETHLKEIWFGSYFFEKGGDPRQEFENHIGINNICKMYSHEIRTTDSWLYYELCQESLGASLFDLKGQTVNGERCYRIQYKQLIYRIRQNISELKTLIIQVAKALHLINSHNIVHSDLKTENILLKLNHNSDERGYIRSLKLIDFGSSFLFTNLKHFSMATPEYMPPEILNYILFQNKLEYDILMLNKMEKYHNAWIIDIWSLGCIVLEIVTGIPLWMSLQTKIQGISNRVTGLFAVKGRLFNKIIQKQIDCVMNLDERLKECTYSGITIDEQMKYLLKRMMHLNPDERISPFQILTYFGVSCQPQRIPFY